MIESIFLQIDATEAATKVDNPLAMVCFIAAVAFALFGGFGWKKGDKTMIYVASGLALALCVVGAVTYTKTFRSYKPELDKLQFRYDSLESENKRYIQELASANQEVKNLKDSKAQLDAAQTEISDLLVQLNQFKNDKEQTIKENVVLKTLDGRPYGFVQNWAVVKNKQGKWGYLRRGQFISKVDFDYKEACRFYSGMAGVRNDENKWGFINSELDLVIPCIYDGAYGFQGDSTKVKLDGDWIWINKRGEKIGEVASK